MGLMALRKFDEKMADMRRNYARFAPEEKEKFRAILEKLASGANEILECAHMLVRVQVEIEVEDEDGDAGWDKIEYSPRHLLDAVKTWDAGEDYAPSALTTFIG